MTANQLEDHVLQETLEEHPAWEAEELQAMSDSARESLESLQDYLLNGFQEPEMEF